ncbi:LLM class flavin-dependent oxidoreductase [Conexivisphaera calida]|uniref:LLM class flavin-dependent oxidoreductase n=1 Tax=Conexivisphaera calida TaxID=1874277 RepID=UPI00157A8FCA|nr:LLM class flavin-dependent oxidoreductase [Conexivisphaera calida]
MRLGIFLFSSVEDAPSRAARAEEEGFDSVWFPEFMTRRPDGREHAEPLTAMSYVAASTRRVDLGTAVLGVLRRHPAVLAQEVATLSRLSGRKIILGIGVGARRQDLALGTWRRVDLTYMSEYVEVLRAFWRGGSVTFHGEHFSIDGAVPAVVPVPGSTVLVPVGGTSDDSLRAAAAVGDGWLANWIFTPGAFADFLSRVRDMASGMGRDPSSIRGYYLTGAALTGDRAARIAFARELAFGVMPGIQRQDYGYRLLRKQGFDVEPERPDQIPEEFLREAFLLGDAEEAVERLGEYEEAGADEVFLHFMDPGSERAFAERVLPRVGRRRGRAGAASPCVKVGTDG